MRDKGKWIPNARLPCCVPIAYRSWKYIRCLCIVVATISISEPSWITARLVACPFSRTTRPDRCVGVECRISSTTIMWRMMKLGWLNDITSLSWVDEHTYTCQVRNQRTRGLDYLSRRWLWPWQISPPRYQWWLSGRPWRSDANQWPCQCAEIRDKMKMSIGKDSEIVDDGDELVLDVPSGVYEWGDRPG